MGECFTCGGAANERYRMVLDSDTVLDDVVMCGECRDSHDEVPWIEIAGVTLLTRDSAPCRVSEATE